MSEEGVELSELTETQQLALQQFTAVTDQEVEAAIPLLRKCEWNVQIAIARFFDGEPVDPVVPEQQNVPPPGSARRGDTLMNGFSEIERPQRNGFEPAPRITSQPQNQSERPTPAFLSLVVAPINIVYNLFSKIFNFLSYLFPFLPRLLTRLSLRSNISRTQRNASGRHPLGPQDTTARFLREFEEEYGANSLPFLETGYARAFDMAKKELKFLLVIPISPEHDNTPSFIRDVLLNESVVNFVSNPANNILLWAGSIQDSEAFQVTTTLNITTFPSAAIIVHTPTVSSTAMSVVGRIIGPTTPENFITAIQNAIGTYSEALSRARSARAEQQAARDLREQQNSAYERSLAQDRERTRQRKEAEAEKARLEREEKDKLAREETRAKNEAQWKIWRAQSILPEPKSATEDVVRLSLRMLDGKRAIRNFASTVNIEEVYAFVECYDILQEGFSEQISEKAVEAPQGYKHEYQFRLVSPIPREVYELSTGGTLKERIGRSGNLFVELIDLEEDE